MEFERGDGRTVFGGYSKIFNENHKRKINQQLFGPHFRGFSNDPCAISNFYLQKFLRSNKAEEFLKKSYWIKKKATQDEINNMQPMGLVLYWLGGGGRFGNIEFPSYSDMAHIFESSNGAQEMKAYLYKEYAVNGSIPEGTLMDDFGRTFTWLFPPRAFTSNTAAQVIGSWNDGRAYAGREFIHFSISNSMSRHSLLFGRQLDDSNCTGYGAHETDLTMKIYWKTVRWE